MLLLAEHFPRELKECITEQDTSDDSKASARRDKKSHTRYFRVRLYSKAACNTRTGGTVQRRRDVMVTDEFYTFV